MKKCYYKLVLLAVLVINTAVKAQVSGCQKNKQNSLSGVASIYYSKDNLRSDSINVIKYTINLDVLDFTNQKIKGNTIVRFTPKTGTLKTLPLDLLKLQIDSVKQNNGLLTYTYNDTLLLVTLSTSLTVIDTSNVIVYYQGKPQGDASGFGGFTFSGNYAYNLGVGFSANPHVYGRAWFPCFDNFIEKSTYEFNITTDTAKRAYCNGALVSDVKNGSVRTRKWILDKEIPSYLACVAVADYTQINWNVNALNGNLPIVLAARAADTTSLKNAFVHLPDAVAGFENYFGPYRWNKIGYSLVPFNGGAMEHATNIAFPLALVNIAYESDLMAHEFAHHWWGDLMTCETQEDMWLNEGMASYSERLFLEWVYGYDKYLAQVKSIHDGLIKHVHFTEKGFRAVSGVPFDYTYSDHVYKKGSDVAHTLRAYMGDAAFFNGLKYVLQQKAFKNMNSLEFRDLLQTSSGLNLTNFFNDWVFSGGWPHFSIDSVKTTGTSAPFTSTVYVKQKLHGAPYLYNNVPLELTYMNAAWQKEIKPIMMSGAAKAFTMQTNTKPVFTGINVDSKISDAISSEYKTIKTNTTITYNLGRATFMVSNKGVDSSYIRVEHNLTNADAFKNNTNNFRLNTQHYWKIDGILSSGFVSKLRLNYDGNKVASGFSYLDTCLTTINGDSIILLYRRNAAADWKEVKNYTKFKISTRSGFFTADTLKLGEYVFANGKSNVLLSVNEKTKKDIEMHIYPNPSKQVVTVSVADYKNNSSQYYEIIDIEGKVVITKINRQKDETNIDVSHLVNGKYILQLIDKNTPIKSEVIIVND